MTLLSKIQNLCDSQGLTLIGLEREIGLGRGTIRKWAESSPSIDKVEKVAKRLNVSLDYLMGTESLDEVKAHNNTERKLLLLARKAIDIPEEQRENLLKHFEDTIDIYLKAKGLHKED